jgi:hypothetical protein
MKKTCPNCSKEFETIRTNKKFCSNNCYKVNQINNVKSYYKKHKEEILAKSRGKKKYPIEKNCIVCKKSFMANNKLHSYCSKVCHYPIQLKNVRAYNQKVWRDPIGREKKREYRKKYDLKNDRHNLDRIRRKNDPEKKAMDKARTKAWYIKKKLEDPYYRVRTVLSSRLNGFLKKEGSQKTASIKILIGATKEELKKHLESKFYKNPKTAEQMTWKNYGSSWEVDHIKPCAAFRDEDITKHETQKKIMNINNLQPLWTFENRSKKDKYTSSK